jgi:hypothetical protein
VRSFILFAVMLAAAVSITYCTAAVLQEYQARRPAISASSPKTIESAFPGIGESRSR